MNTYLLPSYFLPSYLLTLTFLRSYFVPSYLPLPCYFVRACHLSAKDEAGDAMRDAGLSF